MSTYLVTGAAGFIGAKVCELLLADGHLVVGIDNLNDYYDVRLKDYRLGQLLGDDRWKQNHSSTSSIYAGKWRLNSMQLSASTASSRSLNSAIGVFIFEQIDVEDISSLDRLFRNFQFDAVLNLAARAGVRYSLINPHVYMTTNAHGTLNLLECMRKNDVKKFVLASTSSLYAGCPMPFSESQPVNTPLSPYAASKKAAEALAYSYHHLYGIDVSVLRYFTVYGPAGRPDMAPYRFVHWIATSTPISLFGDGNQTRDFTYVDDIAQGTILALRLLGYQIINLGGGNQPITINAMIASLEKRLGKRATIHHLPASPVDMLDTQADISYASRLMGWHPRTAPNHGFDCTADWYSENREWLGSLTVDNVTANARSPTFLTK